MSARLLDSCASWECSCVCGTTDVSHTISRPVLGRNPSLQIEETMLFQRTNCRCLTALPEVAMDCRCVFWLMFIVTSCNLIGLIGLCDESAWNFPIR